MLAIAVLFFLGLWVFITFLAMRIGSKKLKQRWKKPQAGFVGGFLGFMLTMGGFVVYWTVEYIQIQKSILKSLNQNLSPTATLSKHIGRIALTKAVSQLPC